MDCCRVYTQHYISRYIYRGKQIQIPYIAITSEIDQHNLLPFHASDDWLLRLLLPCYESPQKSSLYVETLLRWSFCLLNQKIWSRHDQKWTLMDRL
jgi:hypothetical protein